MVCKRTSETDGPAWYFFLIYQYISPNLSKAPEDVESAMVHRINEEGASYCAAYPDRLGLYASLPLPHVDASIREAEYAVTKLGAYGFGLSTSYAGIYLGNSVYDPMMEYMNSIKTVIAVHSSAASVEPDVNMNVSVPAMEFMIETTRTFMNMEMYDIFSRYPDIRWIFPHAGAFLSILSDRISGFAIMMKAENPSLKLNFK